MRRLFGSTPEPAFRSPPRIRIACADVGTRRSLLVRLAVLGVAVVLPIAGCTPRSGSAAVVQSTRVSVSTFRHAVNTGITPEIAADPAAQEQYQRAVLGLLIDQYVLPQVCAAVGITIDDVQARTLVNQVKQREPDYFKSNGIPPDYELAWAKQTLEARRLDDLIARNPADATRIVDVSKGIAVSVNPRFGKWKAARLAVDPAQTDLSSPPKNDAAPAPTPALGG